MRRGGGERDVAGKPEGGGFVRREGQNDVHFLPQRGKKEERAEHPLRRPPAARVHRVPEVGLGRLLIKRGKYDEARKELQRVLNEKEPRFVADWTVKHTKRARELLDSVKDKS